MAFYMNSTCPQQSKTTPSAVKGGNRGAKGLARLLGRRGIHICSTFRVVEGYNGTILMAWRCNLQPWHSFILAQPMASTGVRLKVRQSD